MELLFSLRGRGEGVLCLLVLACVGWPTCGYFQRVGFWDGGASFECFYIVNRRHKLSLRITLVWGDPRPAPHITMMGMHLTDEDLRKLTIPLEDESKNTYSKCEMYDVDFIQILRENLTWPNSSWPTSSCQHGWFYNFSFYYPTITSQLNWVCDKDTYPTLAQSSYFLGGLFGGVFYGWVADTFGRMTTIVATTLIGGIFELASIFATSFPTYCALRFVVGTTFESQFYTMYILALEFIASPYRTFAANLPMTIFFTTGLTLLPWLAYGVGNWQWLGVCFAAPKLCCILIPWLVPESVRWLMGKGHVDRTVSILEKAAKRNGKKLDPKFKEEFKEYAENFRDENDLSVRWYHLLKTPRLRKRFLVLCAVWICISISYDAQARNAERLPYDFFLTFTFLGLVEGPADFLAIILMEKIGRVHTTGSALLASGLVALSVVFVNESYTLSIAVLAIAGRFLVTMAYNVIMQHVVEIVPTVARGQGSGTVQTLGVAMGFLSPLIVYLSKYGLWLPYSIISALCFAGGLINYLLPETIHQALPDSLEEGEAAFADQPACFNPCARKRVVSKDEENTGSKQRIEKAGNGRGPTAYDNPIPVDEETHL